MKLLHEWWFKNDSVKNQNRLYVSTLENKFWNQTAQTLIETLCTEFNYFIDVQFPLYYTYFSESA